MRLLTKEEKKQVAGGLVLAIDGAIIGAVIAGVTQAMANGIKGDDIFAGVAQSMLEGAAFGAVPLANGAQVAKAIWTFNGLLAVRAGGAVASYYTNPSSGTVTVSDISFYDEAGNFINTQHVEGSSGPVSGGGGDGGGGGGIATGGGGGGGGGGGTVTVSDPVPVEDSPEQTNPG